jgi:hypothetical protein
MERTRWQWGLKSLSVLMLKCVHHCLSTATKRPMDGESTLSVDLILHPLLIARPFFVLCVCDMCFVALFERVAQLLKSSLGSVVMTWAHGSIH